MWSLEGGEFESAQQGTILSVLSLRSVLWAPFFLNYELFLVNKEQPKTCKSSRISLFAVILIIRYECIQALGNQKGKELTVGFVTESPKEWE